jgi:K+/H+ antiporter YhaU regulatory subunit KhtT
LTDLPVQTQRLLGIGGRYTIPADHGLHLMVVAEDRGSRHLAFADPRRDQALATVRLPAEHASVLAALLTGARSTLVTSDQVTGSGDHDPLEVVVETPQVTSGSRLSVYAGRGRSTAGPDEARFITAGHLSIDAGAHYF